MSRGHDFDALYREEGPVLWRTMYAFSGGRRDVADDAVAETFARAIQHADGIRSPAPWLYRTAFRIVSAELKRERRPIEPPEEPEPPPDLTDVIAALRRLSPGQRAAVFLHYRADLPVREIAVLMGTSTAVVKMRLHRGRKRLRELLGTQGDADD